MSIAAWANQSVKLKTHPSLRRHFLVNEDPKLKVTEKSQVQGGPVEPRSQGPGQTSR